MIWWKSMSHSLDLIRRLEANVSRALVGKPEAVRLAVVGLLARGHILIEDVPGVGKTTLAAALARSIGAGFQRIQFTSDMLPSDVIGVSIWEPTKSEFVFKPGPLFTNIVLADEINRTTPKTQSSLLEAMNEARVSLDHSTHPLPAPFMVLATQNPIEHHGTYPLPESQLDRFLLRMRMGYPSPTSEKEILRNHSHRSGDGVQPVMEAREVVAMQEAVERVRVDDSLLDYALEIVERTRGTDRLTLGVSPRGSLMLHRAAQARAFMEGRDFCLPDDFKQLILPVFAHRVVVNTRYASTQKKTEQAEAILNEIVESTRIPL